MDKNNAIKRSNQGFFLTQSEQEDSTIGPNQIVIG
jgi:hypothetical protein